MGLRLNQEAGFAETVDSLNLPLESFGERLRLLQPLGFLDEVIGAHVHEASG